MRGDRVEDTDSGIDGNRSESRVDLYSLVISMNRSALLPAPCPCTDAATTTVTDKEARLHVSHDDTHQPSRTQARSWEDAMDSQFRMVVMGLLVMCGGTLMEHVARPVHMNAYEQEEYLATKYLMPKQAVHELALRCVSPGGWGDMVPEILNLKFMGIGCPAKATAASPGM